ncbi:MAG: 50S ribosomal protein L29 [Proteobacteria bacterium]|nr:50S ribosomal protein L29 [Pseudomonadota bacterium]
MKDIKELRNMTADELQTELLSIRREQFNLRLKKASGSLDKTHLITMARKTVARIKTIMSEKAGENHGK